MVSGDDPECQKLYWSGSEPLSSTVSAIWYCLPIRYLLTSTEAGPAGASFACTPLSRSRGPRPFAAPPKGDACGVARGLLEPRAAPRWVPGGRVARQPGCCNA